MRITLVGPTEPRLLLDRTDAPPGQRAPAVAQLALGLLAAGADVTVVTLCPSVKAPWVRSSGHMTVRVAPSRFRARDLVSNAWRPERAALAREIRLSDPDVVHAHWTYEFALAAQDTGLRRVITIRDAPGTIFRYFRDPYRAARWAIAGIVARRGGVFIANSPYVAKAFSRQVWYRKEIHVIPNGLTDGLLLECRPYQARDSMDLLVIADQSRRKNVVSALHAQHLLEQRGSNSTLTVIGDGLDQGFLDLMAAEARPRSVRMLARQPRPAVRDAIKSCDVIIHPALEESFGNVLLEGMAAGRPIVAGERSGGAPWVVGPAGLLVDVRRPEEIANAVEHLQANPSMAAQMGHRGRSRVLERFTSERITAEHLALYGRLLERQS
ncbi:MAG: glycosyltransferase family 4 protein [Candidatus Nanopelagicales bacterium]|nr:glycosyltransferase family 4 protein [Candidatus Nanopelagicales bacterium]